MGGHKTNYLIFLEQHDLSFTPSNNFIKKRLNLEGKLAILTENRPYSNQNKALQLYASALRDKKNIKKKDLIAKVENSHDYFPECFKRQLKFIEFAAKSGLEFEVVPLDVRSSPKVYQQFKKQDTLFQERLKTLPKFNKRAIEFFEEHAFNAWYTQKKINDLEKQGFSSFLYSVGYSHYASLECYLKEKNCDFSFLLSNPLDKSHNRMIAFFLPERSSEYCFHCGGELK